jgi:hypothetical protein
MPKLWWENQCRSSNGHFGCEEIIDENEDATGLSKTSLSHLVSRLSINHFELVTWARYMIKQVRTATDYEWYKLNSFSRWYSSTGQTIVILFDSPLRLSDQLPELLVENIGPAHLKDPFWIYAGMLERLVDLHDQAVWTIRNQVRIVEKEGMPESRPNPDFRLLHDIGRHSVHVQETLDVAVTSTRSILEHHNAFWDDRLGQNSRLSNSSKYIKSRLSFHEHMFRSLRYRAIANKERLQHEVQLAFNIVTQYDSGTTVEISKAAQSDSASMRTIAFLTLAFLPATFISAVFSMSFFDFDTDTGAWAVSDKFWIYWVVAVPTTLVSVLLGRRL